MVKKITSRENRSEYMRQNYRTLSIPVLKYNKIMPEWKKVVLPTIPKDRSFTVWLTDMLENSIRRQDALNKQFPNLHAIISDGSFIIEDTKTKQVVKVFMESGRIKCSVADHAEDYILFASLHPLFRF